MGWERQEAAAVPGAVRGSPPSLGFVKFTVRLCTQGDTSVST